MSGSLVANGQRGAAFFEVLIAILIFSFGILGVIGLQAAMIRNTGEARYRTEAAQIAQQRIGAIWMDQAQMANYVEAGTDISDRIPSGTRTVEISAANDVTVTITWQQPGSDDIRKFVTVTRIAGGTP